jgi:hypothetical protein
MVKTALTQRLLRIKLKVDRPKDRQYRLADNGRPTRRAGREHWLSAFQHDRRAHAGERAFPWSNGVGLAAHESEVVRKPRLNGKIIHFVVQDYAGSGENHLRAEGGIDGRGAGHPVSIGIRRRYMRGVFAKEIRLRFVRSSRSFDH